MKSKKTDQSVSSEERFERFVFEALCAHGWLLPTTPGAVERAEQEFANTPLALPDSLLTPPDFEDRDDWPQRDASSLAIPRDVSENLARAAREGNVITSEIEARMRADRALAERERSE